MPWNRKKVLKLSKGFVGRINNCANLALPKVERALKFAYRDRKQRRRLARRDWIQSINAACREQDIRYSLLVNYLNKSNIQLDRKSLASLAQNEPYSFKAVIDELKLQGKHEKVVSHKHQTKRISYLEALSNGMLVRGVPPELVRPEDQISEVSMQLRDDIPQKEKEKITIVRWDKA